MGEPRQTPSTSPGTPPATGETRPSSSTSSAKTCEVLKDKLQGSC